MRATIVIPLTFLLSAGPAASGQEQGGAGAPLSVEIQPGGGVALFHSPTEAQAACTGAGGGFGLSNRRFVCVNPRRPLVSTRTDAPPTGPAAAAVSEPPERDSQVESLTLQPGEQASFTIAEGQSHQLLRRAEPSAPAAITISYEVVDNVSRITATSRTGRTLTFRLLADPDGNGGFSPMGEISLPGDGTPAARSWPGSLGAISVGNFARDQDRAD